MHRPSREQTTNGRISVRTADAYTVQFGGTKLGGGSYSIETSSSMAVQTTIDPIKRAMMVTVGTCRIHGALEAMEAVRAAFQFGVDELGTMLDVGPMSSDRPVCLDCESEHFASEPCAEVGTVTRHDRAYRIAGKYVMLPPRMSALLVDSAALWVQRGDKASMVAARRLLRLFASAEDAAEIIHALREVYTQEGTWTLDSIAPQPAWQPPTAKELPAGVPPVLPEAAPDVLQTDS